MLTIIPPTPFRSGVPQLIRVRSTKWLAGATIDFGGGGPVAAFRVGALEWGINVTVAAGDYSTPHTIDAESTLLAGGTESADQVSVTMSLRAPVASTRGVVPPAGAVTQWGDFATLSGSVVSDGAGVTLGAIGVSGQMATPILPIAPGHTLVVVCKSPQNPAITSGARINSQTVVGCGINIGWQSGGFVTSQVISSAGSYVGLVYGTSVRQHLLNLYSTSRNPGSGLTTLRSYPALSGSTVSAVLATTQVAALTPIGLLGQGDVYTYAGVWADELSAADFAQLAIDLAPLLV